MPFHKALGTGSAPLWGIPLRHGAYGMAGHVRFGAKTGGALVILGKILIFIALFFSEAVSIIFKTVCY